MKKNITYIMLLLIVTVVFLGFSTLNQDGRVHLKVTKEENGQKSVFEKIYPTMEDLKSDEDLQRFDSLVDHWANDNKHVSIHGNDEISDGKKKVIIKKKIDGDNEFIWISDEDETINEKSKHIIIEKNGDDEEVIQIKGEKVIKIKSDGEEKVYTITSESEGDHKMVWIEEDGNKTEFTEENIKKMSEDGEHAEVQKKIKVITSEDQDGKQNIFIMESDGDEEKVWTDKDGNKTKLTDDKIEVIVEKEIDENSNEVISDKKVWITRDGEKVELDNKSGYEFHTDGDNITIKVDDETIDIADFSGGKFEGDKVMFLNSNKNGQKGIEQTMNINIEEKDGDKYIDIEIKRNTSFNVTISEIVKNDASLLDSKISLMNNLEPDQLKYYPNPNDGKFNLSFNLDQKDEVSVSVMDILGNEVYKEKLLDFNGAYDNEINLSGKEKGIYILQIRQKKKMLTRKILIE